MRSLRRLHAPYPTRWAFCLTDRQPKRLVAFVHGFRGDALGSWNEFPHVSPNVWWETSDLLFVGYDSGRDTITGVAKRICRELPRFFPHLPDDLLEVNGERVRPSASEPYDELVLAGHSLGGVVVRRVMMDVAQDWLDALTIDPATPRPPLLDARVRLFSPASAGFQPAGPLGLLRASPVWPIVNLVLRYGPAYSELQAGSETLRMTRELTETLYARRPMDLQALRASILWANPDRVVITQRYSTDLVDDAVDGTTHGSVCKPRSDFPVPWTFVEMGHRT